MLGSSMREASEGVNNRRCRTFANVGATYVLNFVHAFLLHFVNIFSVQSIISSGMLSQKRGANSFAVSVERSIISLSNIRILIKQDVSNESTPSDFFNKSVQLDNKRVIMRHDTNVSFFSIYSTTYLDITVPSAVCYKSVKMKSFRRLNAFSFGV